MISTLSFPASLSTKIGNLALRRANREDLPAVLRLLADDFVSAQRDDQAVPEDLSLYEKAFSELTADQSNEMLVVVDEDDPLLAAMQLTRIPGLTRRGSTRLLIEAVRVSDAYRSGGLGTAMMNWVVDVAAPATGSSLVQLTSDDARVDAHRFYERLGFVGSHRGFKRRID
ncbi:GNAT family N-acetyltransferase [Nesterenkonia halotolerans]|uniref:GNAT family N-acetyltransferase n=1 Tax=Nesterenkonia halotolerans TaxID=225325 RepID=UPI003EE80C93